MESWIIFFLKIKPPPRTKVVSHIFGVNYRSALSSTIIYEKSPNAMLRLCFLFQCLFKANTIFDVDILPVIRSIGIAVFLI